MNFCNRANILFRSRARGFTLLEVMIALVITSIGLLGIAKIQALAYASTGSASLRSLVAMQAAGLASSMHTNRNYWSAGLAAPTHDQGQHRRHHGHHHQRHDSEHARQLRGPCRTLQRHDNGRV